MDVGGMRLLIAASDRREFNGFIHSNAPQIGFGSVNWCRTAHLGAHELMLVANGAGAHRAAAAVEATIPNFRPDALISTGYGGGLASELGIADIVVASEVMSGDARFPARPIESARAHQTGVIFTSERVAQTVDERRELRGRGAMVVEMEAAGVARIARAHNLPFYCVKSVTDLAGETLVNDYNRALRDDGHFDTIILLAGSLRHPFARVPELVRLQQRCARAAKALGAFFADCRF